MDLIESYINEVLKHVPEDRRDFVRKALIEKIHYLLKRRTRDNQPTIDDIRAVLQQLGNPAIVAFSYGRILNGMISPEYITPYIFLLTFVLIASIVGNTIAVILTNIFRPFDFWASVLHYLFSACIMAFIIFAGITLIFIMMQNRGIRLKYRSRFVWPQNIFDNQRDSSSAGDTEIAGAAGAPGVTVDFMKNTRNRHLIRISEPVAGLIFGAIFLILINQSPDFISNLLLHGQAKEAAPLLVSLLGKIVPILNVLFCIGIIRDTAKLIVRRWTISLALLNLVLNCAAAVYTIELFTSRTIWESGFVKYLETNILSIGDSLSKVSWLFPEIIIFAVLLGLAVDSIVNLVRAIVYLIKGDV